MSLRLHNTMTRQKEVFTPLDPSLVRLYVCGPTVYDRAHIGNARPLIVFDVLFRLLRHLYGEAHVRYVRNITDVDDKIIDRACERGIGIEELTETTVREFHEDVAALGCLTPTVEPRATDHIPEMIAVIERLIASGNAYAADGHVLFDTPSMPDYGRLSHRSLDEMIAGARVEVAPYKRSDTDFVLWKPARPEEPGWLSPWGRGRPGWHVECSAMSWKHLGETFDIHGGGLDLIFPHHENEIAQSRCAFHTPLMAQIWMHNGFLQVEGQKMSKSLGNFLTIRQVLDQWPKDRYWGEIIRLNMLRTHYRQPVDWTEKALVESRILYGNLLSAVKGQARDGAKPSSAVIERLEDDLNTPAAITELQQLAVQSRVGPAPADAAAELIASWELLGFKDFLRVTQENSKLRLEIAKLLTEAKNEPVTQQATAVLRGEGGSLQARVGRVVASFEARDAGIDPAVIEVLVQKRLTARAAKEWAKSDRIRDELAAMGIALKDDKDGTTSWSLRQEGDPW